jgi:Ca-activated chloride channel family protein
MLDEFHFLRPWWLLAFVPIIVFLIWFAQRRFAMLRWANIIDPQLMPHVLIGTGYRTRRRITTVLSLAGGLLVLALAGPAWQRLPQPVYRSQDALIIALDLSRSMDVADIKPSRLARARFKISDILTQRVEGQSALLVYAAEAYVVSPLTDDTRTIISQLPALTTDLMPMQGSRADRALIRAAELLQQAGINKGHVLLVTDGVDLDQVAATASELRDSGIRVSALGVGTADGGPIPGPGGFVKRADGSIVIAKFDAPGLRELTAKGGGLFQQLAADEADVDQLIARLGTRVAETEDTDLKVDVWREEGPWLLLPLLPLAALAFRRGVVAVWLLACILPIRPAEALEWSDLWSRPDQRASRLFEAGDAAGAAELFDNPAWKGAAEHRAGLYEESLAALDGLDDMDARYNRGNSLARLGRYDEAIAAYTDVLDSDPNHRDARYNRDLLLEQQKQQQQPSTGGQSDQQSGETQDSSDGSDSQAHSGQQEQNSDEQTAQQPDGGKNSADDDMSQANADQPDAAGGAQSGETGQDESPSDQSDAAAAAETAKDPALQESERAPDGEPDDTPTTPLVDNSTPDEDAQATEQWLRRIPDDPGGLLRRKFLYQYQQQNRGPQEDQQW